MDATRLLENIPHLIVLLILTIISGCISGSETALFALTRQQLNRYRQSTHRVSQLIVRLREHPRILLSTVLLANIAVNILLYSSLAVTVNRIAEGNVIATTIFGVGGFFIVLIGAEIGPKLAAFAFCDKLAPVAAPWLRFLEYITAPGRWLLERPIIMPLTRLLAGPTADHTVVSPADLQQLVNISQSQGTIDQRETFILHQVMDLADANVGALMIPRVDVVAFNLDDPSDALVNLIRKSRLPRIPVYRGSIDNILGVIEAKEFLLNRDLPLDDLVRRAYFIPEQASVDALLSHFRQKVSQLAIVVDEYGGLAGVVTLEEFVEAIVGELDAVDEHRIRPPLTRIDDTTYLVDAGLDVNDFGRAFDLPIEESRVNTVGGLVAELLDRIPRRGDEINLGNGRLKVHKMRGHRLISVRLTLDQPPIESADLAFLLASAPSKNEGDGKPPSNGGAP